MKTTARNADYTKEYNRKLILRYLRQAPLSRAELSRKTGLTRAAVTLITEELFRDNIVAQLPVVSVAKGRSPIPLVLCGESCYALGVYLSRKDCILGLCDINGKVLDSTHMDIDVLQSPVWALDAIAKESQRMIETFDIPREKLLGIGMSAPGPLDKKSGRLISPSRFSAWNEVGISQILSEKTGLAVKLENNAYSIALYEKAYGVAKTLNNYLLLLVDSGVGGAIVKDQHLYEGAGGFSGEIGHTTIVYNGIPCPCGRRGCLEAYASIPALLSRRDLPYSAWDKVTESAKTGNGNAIDIINEEIEYLAAAVQNVANLFGIDALILDGDLADAFDLIAPHLERSVNSSGPAKYFTDIKAYKATGGDSARVVAGANILFESYLQ